MSAWRSSVRPLEAAMTWTRRMRHSMTAAVVADASASPREGARIRRRLRAQVMMGGEGTVTLSSTICATASAPSA